MKKLLQILTILGFIVLCASIQTSQAAYFDKTISQGQLRIFYKSPSPATCDAILLGVGTAMTRADYDNLANQLITYGYVVVIMDHVPGNMVKKDVTKYKNCALAVQAGLVSWMAGKGCTAINNWILGGHSCGGEAAQKAIVANPGLADAIFSIDPWDNTGTGSVNIPALYWGFNVTSCFVGMENAAKLAYYGSMGERAFYRVKKIYSWGPCGYAPKFLHCSFCDGHCPACTNCMLTPSYFFTDVAKTVNKFINAAFYGTWSKANLTVSTTTPTELFVDSDTP